MERKSLFAGNKRRGSTGNRPETFAFVVDSYDLDAEVPAVIGTRLDGGAQVRVTLRDIPQGGENARAEIADFASERTDRNHPGTVPGGIMLAQEAFLNDDGAHAARWIQVLSHEPGEAEVFQATVTVSDVNVKTEKQGNRPVTKYSAYMQLVHAGNFGHVSPQTIEQLKLTDAFPVANLNDLKEAITALLMDDLGVGVRVHGDDGFDGSTVRFDRKKHRELKTEDEKVAHAAKAAEEFVEGLGELAAAIDSGSIGCEVISYSTIWAGPKTAQSLKTRPVMQQRLNRFGEQVNLRNGEERRQQLFRPAIVAVRRTKPGDDGTSGIYFSHVEPLNTAPPRRGITEAIVYTATAQFTPPAEAKEEAAAAPAQRQAAGEQQGAASQSGAVTDDDLMGGLAPDGADGFDAGFGDSGFDDHAPAAAAPASAPAKRNYAGRRAA